LELVGVLFVGFELVDELDLTVEKRLVASSQVDEDVADALAKQGGLLAGNVLGHFLDRVERIRELADLVAAVDGDGLELLSDGVTGGVAELLDQCRQTLFRKTVRTSGQLGEWAGDRAGDDRSEQEGDEACGESAEQEVASFGS